MQPYLSSADDGGYDRGHDSPTGSGRGEDRRDDAKASDKGGERRGVINRVNRACNNCRRMKMRCVGAEDPPCKRCRNGNLDCIMEKPGRTAADSGGEESRIRSLESQVTSIQNTLSDLVQTLRAGMAQPASSNASNGSGNTPVNAVLSPPQSISIAPAVLKQVYPSAATSSPVQVIHPVTALGSQPQYSQDMPSSGMLGKRPPFSAPYNPYVDSPASTGLGMAHGDSLTPTTSHGAADASRSSPYQDSSSGFRRPPIPTPVQGGGPNSTSSTWEVFAAPGSTRSGSGNHDASLPPSRPDSEADDMPGAEEEIVNPLGSMSNMASLVEAAVERTREERGRTASPLASKRANAVDQESSPDERGLKRARHNSNVSVVVEAQGLPQTIGPSKSKAKIKRAHVHAYPDCVEEGIVSEEEARELVGIYYSGSSNFIPCFDPSFDTFESLKIRSPFSLTCIVMVGARVRDGGTRVSEVQRLCRQHAQKIAMGTLFNSVARVEAVQAMSILAAFSDNGWLPGGHAVRMALDMGIDKSFLKLVQTGMGHGRTAEELEDERPLVVHSRVWFCLYLMEHQMAYGMGRPAILREDETIQRCRELLEHPLSTMTDARLISTVELTALRAPLHIELTATPDLPIDQQTLQRLKKANNDFDLWERHWDRILADRYGKAQGDFFRESLAIQRQYAELFVNSQLLRGIREPSDVVSMPPDMRALALRAIQNAQNCMNICLHGQNYRNGLRYAVHYTHVCAAFAASFLIRSARLFPKELELKKTAKDVEELARVLSEVPAGRYARSLRLILRRARKAKVIPATSGNASPTRADRAPASTSAMSTQSPAQSSRGPGSNPPIPAFSPTSMFLSSGPTPGPISPNHLLLTATSQIMEDSPQSAPDITEFDMLFAQENLERSGLKLGEGDPLPLYLDGQSLGGFGTTDIAPFVGLENFFLPAEVDYRLAPNIGEANPGGDLLW